MIEENGYVLLKNVISKDLAKAASYELEILRKIKHLTHNIDERATTVFNDSQVVHCYKEYSPPIGESISLVMKPTMESTVGKKLLPTYSYGRIYYNGAEMHPHTDRDACEYSITLCLSIDKEVGPWKIGFLNREKKAISFSLYPGDGLAYKGRELDHWRKPYKGKKQCQLFLHYVDAQGDFKYHVYDGRKFLGLQKDEYTKVNLF